MWGQIAYDWKTMPRPRSFGGTRTLRSEEKRTRPATLISPLSGVSRPAMQRSVVVLPQPDGPSSVKSWPSSTSNEMSSTASTRLRVSAFAAANDLKRFRTSSMARPP